MVTALVALLVLALLLPGCSLVSKDACRLSFKPFTTRELLTLHLEIDTRTTGKLIQTPELKTIEKRTSKVRGLPFKKPVTFVAMNEECLRAVLISTQYEENPPGDVEADQKLMVALGLMGPTMSLEEIVTNVLTEQVAGSYDTLEKDITIVQNKGAATAMDQITMSHEITHALQDQNYDLEKAPLKKKSYDGDNDLAIKSLIEGDATATMFAYAQKYMTLSQLMQVQNQGGEVSMTQFNKAPLYVRRSLLFPYEEGLKFVGALKKKGGESAVDAAFLDPPLSSEQVIHPEKYMSGESPVKIVVPDISRTLGTGWKRINKNALGEFDLDVWFDQYGVTAGARAAEGWAGNTIQYYQGPTGKNVPRGSLDLGNYAVLSLFQWDSANVATDFADAYKKLLDSRYKKKSPRTIKGENAFLLAAEGQYYYCGRSGNRTMLLQANTLDYIARALTRFPEFPGAPK